MTERLDASGEVFNEVSLHWIAPLAMTAEMGIVSLTAHTRPRNDVIGRITCALRGSFQIALLCCVRLPLIIAALSANGLCPISFVGLLVTAWAIVPPFGNQIALVGYYYLFHFE
jgi:hypothetical protein